MRQLSSAIRMADCYVNNKKINISKNEIETFISMDMRNKALQILRSAVASVDPYNLVSSGVKIDSNSKNINFFGTSYDASTNYHVIGFGKAVAGMAAALQDVLQHRLRGGMLSVPINSKIHLKPSINVHMGGKNNLPDNDSVSATEEILKFTKTIPEQDVLIVLVSGGGSTLLCKPIPDITLSDKLLAIKLLTESGADIEELNTVRKHLSLVKGGGLLKYCSHMQTVCVILSDVIGDPLSIIASGPTFVDQGDVGGALEVIRRHRLELKLPRHVLRCLQTKRIVQLEEMPTNVVNKIIGSNKIALRSGKDREETKNIKIVCVSSQIKGLVTDIGSLYLSLSLGILKYLKFGNATEFYAEMRNHIRKNNIQTLSPYIVNDIMTPLQDNNTDAICLLLGGETTVQVKGKGVGGRNQELSVIFSQLIFNAKIKEPSLFTEWNVLLLSAGTDGIDGPTDAAGAYGCCEFLEVCNAKGINVDNFLANNDTYTLLSLVNNGEYHIKTGPTGTNVMDIHVLILYKKSQIKSAL